MAEQSEISQILQHLVAQSARQERQLDQLTTEVRRTSSILETVVIVQGKMLDQMQLIYEEQQHINRDQRAFNAEQKTFNARQEEFNARQEAFNSRQEDTDAILLSELREIRSDLRELKNVVLTDHEERLRRLEDFMRRAS